MVPSNAADLKVNCAVTNLLIAITAHAEGDLLSRAYACAEKIRSELQNISAVKILLTLDVPDEATSAVASKTGAEIIRFEFGDVGAVRNWVLTNRSSHYDSTLFLDGDDLTESSWILESISLLEGLDRPALASPNCRVDVFPNRAQSRLEFRQPNVAKNFLFWTTLTRVTNLWHSCVIFNKQASESLRYPLEKEGQLFEDWALNIEAMKLKIPHFTFTGKVFYYRRKSSRLKSQQRKLLKSSDVRSLTRNLARKFGGAFLLFLSMRKCSAGGK